MTVKLTVSELQNYLEETYELCCFVDIADVCLTRSYAHDMLSAVYRYEYKYNQRLVFYSGFKPNIHVIKHIIEAATFLNISQCFLLFCCPDIDNELQELGSESDFAKCIPLTLDSKPLPEFTFNVPASICPLPWMHLELGNNGDVKPCCIFQGTVGNINDSRIVEIFDQLKNLRQEFLAGNQPTGCSSCWITEKQHGTSERQRHLALYEKEIKTHWLDEPLIRSLDIKAGNVCNFKCRICSPEFSSSHAAEVLKFDHSIEPKIKIQKITKSSQWLDSDTNNITHQLRELLPSLQNIDIYGGEPFLLKGLESFLSDAVVKNYAKNIRIHFNTNGSVFPEHLIPLLLHFKHVDIAISVDNVREKFEIERGGSWPLIESSIEKFSELNKLSKFHVYVYTTVNIQNILDLNDIISWCESKNLGVMLRQLTEPASYAVTELTEDAKQLVLAKYSSSVNPEIQSLVCSIKNTNPKSGEKFRTQTQMFDSRRNQDFSVTHPEISSVMGYNGNP